MKPLWPILQFIRNRLAKASKIETKSPINDRTKPQSFCCKLFSPETKQVNNNQNKNKNMSTLEELSQERQKLEERVRVLTEKLEARKSELEAKVPTSMVIKNKEEWDPPTAAVAKLNITAPPPPSSDSGVATTVTNPAKDKKPAKGGGKQRGGAKEPPAPERPVDVSRLDLRIGRIIEVERHPDADALYVEKIDCGDATGPRTVISGLVKHVPIEEMKDRMVVVLCNLKPAKMRGILSEAMVMCASSEDKIELLQPPADVKPGQRVIFDGYEGDPDSQLNPKKKIWESVAPDLKTDDQGIAKYKNSLFKVEGVSGEFKSNFKDVNIR